jgi:hypothetical protein
MRKLATLALAAVFSASLAQAEEAARTPGQQAQNQAPRAADARVDALMRALDRAVRELPGYAAPEIDARGDIVIRRQPAPTPPARARAPDEARI